MRSDVDVCVVGGGPGGLSAAKRCAERGLTVQLLERGVAPDGAQSYLSARGAAAASDFRRRGRGHPARRRQPVDGIGTGRRDDSFAGIFPADAGI